MLLSLHVSNLALIDDAEVWFGDGFNIFSGETGAGKSLVIGSVAIALGAKAGKDMVREGADKAEVELTFSVDRDEQREWLKSKDIPCEDDELIIRRRISNGRGVAKLNGVTVPSSVLKEVAGLFVDVHGQRDNSSLLQEKQHLRLLDKYCSDDLNKLKEEYLSNYNEWKSLVKTRDSGSGDKSERARKADLLKFEIKEIEAAELRVGEDEELEKRYRVMNNSMKIVEALSEVEEEICGSESARMLIGRALRALSPVPGLDPAGSSLLDELNSIDALVGDFSRDLSDYMSGMEFSEQEFAETEKRLDAINSLKVKYSPSIEGILKELDQRKEELQRLENYDEYESLLNQKIAAAEKSLSKLANDISEIRKEAAPKLSEEIRQALTELNFNGCKFNVELKSFPGHFTLDGIDEAEFYIAPNEGEKMSPLKDTASGGELSRIMLALKTVLSDAEDTDTLIFDEIDTGISGRTAQKVSESLHKLSRRHQVICITHLPQIAAMADHHFLIEKKVQSGRTVTGIRELAEDESIRELGRLLGGAEITDKVLDNAKEMRSLAAQVKKRYS
ncbi:MAG: DNA repair protein RecN [Lachnospiraceae bacterium]|nr:DNA repair protein RecN [Lachnospiraceae bacterium]